MGREAIVVAAAAAVVAHGDVDGDGGECVAEVGEDILLGFEDEGEELGVSGVGEEQLVAAVVLVADEVSSGENGEAGVSGGGLGVDGGEGGAARAGRRGRRGA